MSEKDQEEFRNAIRRIGYCSVRLESPYDRVRVSEWIRKLVLMDDDNYDNIKKRNDYIQYLKIQVTHGVIQLPFSKPPPESDLPTLPQMLGNTICSRVPDLPKTGPITPAIIHKSPDGRAYISIKHVPGDGVLCYMAVTPNPEELEKNKEQRMALTGTVIRGGMDVLKVWYLRRSAHPYLKPFPDNAVEAKNYNIMLYEISLNDEYLLRQMSNRDL